MSRKSSKSSSSAGGEVEESAVRASSTPIKNPPPRLSGGGVPSPSHTLSVSGDRPAPSPVTPIPDRNVQIVPGAPRPKMRSGGGGGGQSAQHHASSGLLDLSLDQSSNATYGLSDLEFSLDLDLSSLADGHWTINSLSRLLEEEAEDVRQVSKVTGSWGIDSSDSLAPPPPQFPPGESLRHAQRDLRAMPVGDNVLFLGEGEEPGNLTPTELAAMMHRLENGVSMAAPPEQLFKFLFPSKSKAAVAATKTRLDDSSGGVETDLEAKSAERQEARAPNENTLHKDESCPIVCFGGGYPPKAHTLTQFRGDAPPPWFPGYFIALPETRGVLQVKKSPTDVIQAAYMSARPCNISPDCRFVY